MTVAEPLVLLFTDFGTDGPYLGQVEAAILAESLQSRVVNYVADAPCGDPRRAAYLLASLATVMPVGCVVVAVVDPGVGGAREPLLLEADGRTFIGPDNGLLSRVAAQADAVAAWCIDWRPERLSPSFHGRDLFAPVAGFLSRGQGVTCTERAPQTLVGWDWPRELDEVIYIDHFGNAMTGLAAADKGRDAVLDANGIHCRFAATFSAVPHGQAFWYENSSGLVEVAVNQGRAATDLGLRIGDRLRWVAA